MHQHQTLRMLHITCYMSDIIPHVQAQTQQAGAVDSKHVDSRSPFLSFCFQLFPSPFSVYLFPCHSIYVFLLTFVSFSSLFLSLSFSLYLLPYPSFHFLLPPSTFSFPSFSFFPSLCMSFHILGVPPSM